MREPKKNFAFAGDWHENWYWAQSSIRLLAESHEVDTILHTGDYGYKFGKQFRSIVETTCAENDVTIYFVDGNHDNHEWIWQCPKDDDGLNIISDHVKYIPRGHHWNWWGKEFVGVGGAVSVDKAFRKTDGPDAEWWATETLTQADFYNITSAGKADVWISHDCPEGVNIPGIIKGERKRGGWPDSALAAAEKHREFMYQIYDVVKPGLIVHGHYHRLYATSFKGTRVVGLAEDATSFNENLWVVKSVNDLTSTLEIKVDG